MDKQLLENYAHAIRARPVLRLLPDGLREYSLQYELLLLDDIRAQAGNSELNESEVLAMAPTTTSKIVQALLPVVGEIALALVKKYFPTAAASGAVSAAITYLTIK